MDKFTENYKTANKKQLQEDLEEHDSHVCVAYIAIAFVASFAVCVVVLFWKLL